MQRTTLKGGRERRRLVKSLPSRLVGWPHSRADGTIEPIEIRGHFAILRLLQLEILFKEVFSNITVVLKIKCTHF